LRQWRLRVGTSNKRINELWKAVTLLKESVCHTKPIIESEDMEYFQRKWK